MGGGIAGIKGTSILIKTVRIAEAASRSHRIAAKTRLNITAVRGTGIAIGTIRTRATAS
jgi:hypothetical protein